MEKSFRTWGGAVAALVLGAISAQGAGAAERAPAPTDMLAAGRCDRACLHALTDQVFAAMAAHDASRLPLRDGVRYTENGQTLRLNDGLWQTAEAVSSSYAMYVEDAQSGSAAYMGAIQESGRTAMITLRLQVEGRKISQIEVVIARTSGAGGGGFGGGSYSDVKTLPVFDEVLPQAQRRSREQLIATANSYFEGLEQATGKVTPFEPSCQRRENGSITANNPDAKNAMSKLSCGAQFDTGFSPFITEVRGRRFPLVDEERGLVLCFLSFDHSGRIKSVRRTDGTIAKVPAPFDTPYSFLIAELFKIRDGRIAQVEAVLLPTPYGMPGGW
ncbi:MAG TPA: hypothetical protein VGV09_18510 [Steroidobacteraceae bacterium]|nr:hypothetical protein [Steroidobacteraceae bacterium]